MLVHPQTSARRRPTCSSDVTATIGDFGRYLEIIFAVYPLSVGATIAATSRASAVCANRLANASVIVGVNSLIRF